MAISALEVLTQHLPPVNRPSAQAAVFKAVREVPSKAGQRLPSWMHKVEEDLDQT